MKIISHIPGRIRIRHKWLKDNNASVSFLESLSFINELYSVEHNHITGSILLTYDSNLDMKEMTLKLEEYWEECFNDLPQVISDKLDKVRHRRNKRTFLNVGMIVTLVGTWITLAFDNIRWHVLYGSAMTVLVFGHMMINRKPLARSLRLSI